MQHRKSASMSVIGRPSGTDGSDFSYRMVVDSRYTKVAQGKSRLYSVIIAQVLIQLIGVLYLFLSSKEKLDVFATSSIAIGFVSMMIGELGRRRSRVGLLKVYMIVSSIAILVSAACLTKSKSAMAVIQDPSNWRSEKFALIEICHVLLGSLIQLFAIRTTISLIGNMSPPKRAS